MLYLVTSAGSSILGEWKSANWTTYVLGIAIVGLEAGSIYMFRAGWDVSVGPMVKNAVIAVALLAVGLFVYREPVTGTKVAGIGSILLGLWLTSR